ncbi:hypothetical protein J2785_007250 [Burkholderia ambifaria]|nr:DUF2844 domain-containing protein [Burkholderia ambifaria]MDR6504056.1 hypothetical protein [Burkholderia ambifaria]
MKQSLRGGAMPKYFAGVKFIGSCFLFAYIPLSVAALGVAPMETPPGAGVSSKIELKPTFSKYNNASPASDYSIVETRLSAGDILREYVAYDNRVFAVVWEGRHMPDMATLLGGYFNQYRTALMKQRTSRDSHTPVGVVLDDLIVYVSGRTHNVYVRVWLPKALPAGVQPNAIR